MVQLAIITTLAFTNAGSRAPAETTVLVVFSGLLALLWAGGVAALLLRPKVARRPTRPTTPRPPHARLLAAGVIAVASYFGVLLLATKSVAGVLAVGAVNVGLAVVLAVSARRIDDRAEAAGRPPFRPVNPGRAE